MLDRKSTRHGINIHRREERRIEDVIQKNPMFQSVIVVEFISNPAEYLSEKVDIVQTSPNFKEKTTQRGYRALKKRLKDRKKANKFNRSSSERLEMVNVDIVNNLRNQAAEARKIARETVEKIKEEIIELIRNLGEMFKLDDFLELQNKSKAGVLNNLISKLKNRNSSNNLDNDFDIRELNVSRLEAHTLKGSSESVKNPELVSIMPRNSILGINISDVNNADPSSPEVFFPFYPSHFSLPVKPGEQVWVFYDNIQGKKVGYWMHRKVGTLPVEDLNYTHLDRNNVIQTAKNVLNSDATTAVKIEIIEKVFSGFVNASNSTAAESKTLPGGDSEYDNIITDSKSYTEEFVGEAVPRHNKKCGDLVLQGSNNTLINLTHEHEKDSGVIELVAGRKIPNNRKIKNIRINPEAKYFEHDQVTHFGDLITEKNIKAGIPESYSEIEEFNQSFASAHLSVGQGNGGYIKLRSVGSIESSAARVDTYANTISNLSVSTFFDSHNHSIDTGEATTVCQGKFILESPFIDIKAKDKIKINSRRIDLNKADEPYVIHSSLEEILDGLLADTYKNNLVIEALVQSLSTILVTAPVVEAIDAALFAQGASLNSIITPPEFSRITQNPNGPMNKLKSKTIFGSE